MDFKLDQDITSRKLSKEARDQLESSPEYMELAKKMYERQNMGVDPYTGINDQVSGKLSDEALYQLQQTPEYGQLAQDVYDEASPRGRLLREDEIEERQKSEAYKKLLEKYYGQE